MKETWKSIDGYDDIYEVSNMGRVKSLKRKGRVNDIIIRQSTRDDGYKMVVLRKDRKSQSFFVHRLVLSSFTGNLNPDIFNQVNHINSNRADNRLSNLEWSNNSLNQKHAFKYGFQNNTGDNNPGHKISSSDVKKIKLALNCGISSQSLADIYHVSKSTIKDIRHERCWSNIKLKVI